MRHIFFWSQGVGRSPHSPSSKLTREKGSLSNGWKLLLWEGNRIAEAGLRKPACMEYPLCPTPRQRLVFGELPLQDLALAMPGAVQGTWSWELEVGLEASWGI